jgi:hypothetical protein
MNTDIQVPKNFQEAYMYVNSRYVFDEKNYPEIKIIKEKKFSIGNKIIIFSLRHSLLHILKNFRNIECIVIGENKDRIHFSSELEKSSFVKMWINIFAIAHIFDGTTDLLKSVNKIEEKMKSNEIAANYSLYQEVFRLVTVFAIELEKADHEQYSCDILQMAKVFDEVAGLFYGLTIKSKSEIFSEIPNYMKSK